ncbi:hypothetical protein QBC45DRAFT_62001 [Copromyces sp. CBS 386.78]|nr:hypothetical protein QBC45DRAFT_62001 [Copromyces sp. CBS 386.78]
MDPLQQEVERLERRNQSLDSELTEATQSLGRAQADVQRLTAEAVENLRQLNQLTRDDRTKPGEGDEVIIAREIRDVAHSLKESLEKFRTEFDRIAWHRGDLAARERAMEEKAQEAANCLQQAEKKAREAQQALQQAEQKDREAQAKLNQLEQARRQQQQDELQLITRRQDLEGLTQQAEQQARERRALDAEKAVVAQDKEELARNKHAFEVLRQEIGRPETSLEQMGTLLQEKLSPALEKLDNLSVQVGEIQQFIETADQTNDGLAEAQREVASTTTLTFQQSESVVSKLDGLSGQVQTVQDVAEGTGLRAYLALLEDTIRIKEEEHDRMVDELRTEMANAARSEEFGQALDDIRNVPQQVELVKTILTTEIQSLNTLVANLRERNAELSIQLEAYCGGSATGSGTFNREWLALVNELRRRLLAINVSKSQGCNLRTILYHISKAVQNSSSNFHLEVFRVASEWNQWYCWEDVMNRGQDAAVVQGTCSLHQNACFQVKRVEKGFADLLVFRGPNLVL